MQCPHSPVQEALRLGRRPQRLSAESVESVQSLSSESRAGGGGCPSLTPDLSPQPVFELGPGDASFLAKYPPDEIWIQGACSSSASVPLVIARGAVNHFAE